MKEWVDAGALLGRVLDRAGLRELFALYGNHVVRHSAMGFDSQFYPPTLQLLTELFVLGNAVEGERLVGILSAGDIAILSKLGLLRLTDEGLLQAEYVAYAHFGCIIFAQRRRFSRDMYFGNDSLALAKVLLPVRGQVLDVCTGPGAQAILCAQSTPSVIGLDVNNRLREIFWFNAGLNGVAARLTFLVLDVLKDPLPRVKVDRFICNPPLLPVPDGVEYAAVGNGGPDGNIFFSSIASQLHRLLTADGSAHFVGTVFGDSDGPFLSIFKRRELADFNIVLFCPFRAELGVGSSMRQELVRTAMGCGTDRVLAEKSYAMLERSVGATYLYSYIATLRRCGHGPSAISVVPFYLRGCDFWSA